MLVIQLKNQILIQKLMKLKKNTDYTQDKDITTPEFNKLTD